MKKELKESIIIITTVTFTIIQLIFYIQYTLTANKSTTSQVTNVFEIKDEEVKFTTINDELKVLDNSYISDANYIGDRWKVKIVLVGNSDQITNSLNKLKNMGKYTINEYNIDGCSFINIRLYARWYCRCRNYYSYGYDRSFYTTMFTIW